METTAAASSPLANPPDPAAFAAWALVQQAQKLELAILAAREAIPAVHGHKWQKAELARAVMCCRRLIRALGSVAQAPDLASKEDPMALRPVRLTASQMSSVLTAAEPLAKADRSRFLGELAAQLRNEPGELGDGQVARAIRNAVKPFFRPPAVTHEPSPHRNVGPALE